MKIRFHITEIPFNLHLIQLGPIEGVMLDFSEAISIQHPEAKREENSTDSNFLLEVKQVQCAFWTCLFGMGCSLLVSPPQPGLQHTVTFVLFECWTLCAERDSVSAHDRGQHPLRPCLC